jgi:glycosyltransferase involved in cell wall biosynthesis
LKILIVHNSYREPGGEDVVVAQEQRLLKRKGHSVIEYARSNHEASNSSVIDRMRLLKTIVSAQDSRMDVQRLLETERPDIVHIHNTFMMVSPSIYQACVEAKIPTVQTIHNYRLLCPATYLFRDGKVCEECIDHGLMSGVQHGCYRNSRLTTAAVALMLQVHRTCGTWTNKVDAFIVLTEFAKKKFTEHGLPSGKVHIKPNFVERDPGERREAGDYVLFVGRLSQEKGVAVLLDAWKLLKIPLPLRIVGDGPSRPALEARVEKENLNNVEFLGRLDGDQTRDQMKKSRFLVVPSLWYEGFPMVIAESFACGLPVLGSRLGAMQEVIDDGHDGLHFTGGSPDDLAGKAAWAWEHPGEMAAMGRNARRKYEERFGPETNYSLLMEIYSKASAMKTAEAPLLTLETPNNIGEAWISE